VGNYQIIRRRSISPKPPTSDTLRFMSKSAWHSAGVQRILTTAALLLIANLFAPIHAASAMNLGKIVKLRVASPESDYPIRDVFVWTPNIGRTDPRSLPVVYLLHGWSGSPAGLISAVQRPLAIAFAAGARPFIAVFPDGNAKTHPDSEWADSSDKEAMIETWLTTRVIAKVEAGRIRSSKERAIAGFSMGGYGAAIIALHHPNLFGQIASLSGYYITDDLSAAFTTPTKERYQSPSTYLKMAPKIRWMLIEGRDDYTIPIRGQALDWSKKLSSVKAKFTLSNPPGGHTFVYVSSQMAPLSNWFAWPAKTT
jgi:S-formylglutathione hydrolase FrmB